MAHPLETPYGDGIVAVAVSPDGSTAASGSQEGAVVLWDLDTGAVIRTLRVSAGHPDSLAFSPDGSRLACATVFGELLAWDLVSGARILQAPAREHAYPRFSPDGQYAAGGAGPGEVGLYDLRTGTCVATKPGHVAFLTPQATGATGPPELRARDLSAIPGAPPEPILRACGSTDGQTVAALVGRWGSARLLVARPGKPDAAVVNTPVGTEPIA